MEKITQHFQIIAYNCTVFRNFICDSGNLTAFFNLSSLLSFLRKINHWVALHESYFLYGKKGPWGALSASSLLAYQYKFFWSFFTDFIFLGFLFLKFYFPRWILGQRSPHWAHAHKRLPLESETYCQIRSPDQIRHSDDRTVDDSCQWDLTCHQDSLLPDSIRLSLSPAVPMFWFLFLCEESYSYFYWHNLFLFLWLILNSNSILKHVKIKCYTSNTVSLT